MTKVIYRGEHIHRIGKRNSNLKWRVRLAGDEEPMRFRTKADAMAFIDRVHERALAQEN